MSKLISRFLASSTDSCTHMFVLQLYIITEKGANDVWIKEAELSGISLSQKSQLYHLLLPLALPGIHVVKSHCPAGHAMYALLTSTSQCNTVSVLYCIWFGPPYI